MGSSTSAQVTAWVDTGLSVAQVFQAFALSDQFTASQTAQNEAIFFPTVVIAPFPNLFNYILNGPTTFNDGGNYVDGTTAGGTTTSGLSMVVLSGALVSDQIVFNNITNEFLANFGSGSSKVNVSGASTLAQALDLAAADAAATQPGHLVPAQTGVIDWFQYGGDTYIVEAVNPTGSPGGSRRCGPLRLGDQARWAN